MNKWPKVTMADLASAEDRSITKPYGSSIVKEDYRAAGVPVVRGVNLAEGRFHDDDFVFISEEQADTLAASNLLPGDLVFTHRGSVGQVSMIPRKPRHRRYACSTSQVKARLDPAKAIPEFYFYWFQSAAGQRSILANLSTVGVPGLVQPTATVKSLRVPHPPIETQRGIAATLGALDDKIGSIRHIVELIPQLIRAKIDFAIAEGADAVAVSELAAFVNGGAYTNGATGTGRMVIRIADLNSGPGPSTVYNDIEVPDDKTARAGDILMSWSGSLGVYRWARTEAIINQHIFKVLPREGIPAWLVHDRLDAVIPVFRGVASDKATTMGHIQRGHLDTTAVIVPSQPAIEDLDHELPPLWERLLLADCEIHRLAALRDALLPELLSGRIRVAEAVDAVA